MILKMFSYKLPFPLIDLHDPEEKKEEKLTGEIKKDNTNNEDASLKIPNSITNINPSISENKEDDTHTSGTFLELNEKQKKENETNKLKPTFNDKDLEANVYITLTETPTNLMYFAPSMKYYKDKVDDKQEKKKEEVFKNFKEKRRNKESFADRGAQTVNRFLRNQIVSTSSTVDQDSNTHEEKDVSALKWNIVDSINENRSKKEDDSRTFQKALEKRIKKELTEKVRTIEINPEESYSMHKSQASETTYSIADMKFSQSLISSRRPGRGSQNVTVKESEDKSMIDQSKGGHSSPSSSALKKDGTTNDQASKLVSQVPKQEKGDLTMALPSSIINPLRYVERLLSQNQFLYRQIAYKNYPISPDQNLPKKEMRNDVLGGYDMGSSGNDEEKLSYQEKILQKEIEFVQNKDDEPNIKPLFRFSGHKILNDGSKYIVHTLDWNPYNKDLLAAGYGDPDIDSKKEGLLCFWTLKNPLHPERVIKTPRGITSCNFSNKNPYYIVASDYAGEIMIYDLRVNSSKPIADSTEIKEKHTDIVWEAKWIEKPNDKNEMIASISSDGKVKEWYLKKGLEVSDLMRMKKNISFQDKSVSPFAKHHAHKDGAKESLVFREANGLSFDFPKNDNTIYYISLEECTMHRCRISYKDQYTDTYTGHQGPVYKVRCNPFEPTVLLSCSYDWTIKIWNSKIHNPLMTCHSMKTASQVNDIEWSPFTSTIFGGVFDDGRIEIWDLARQNIEPILTYKSSETQKLNVPIKSIKFSRSSQVVACGDADFDIDIFRLYNLKHVEVR
jgi:WD40 repeat protein